MNKRNQLLSQFQVGQNWVEKRKSYLHHSNWTPIIDMEKEVPKTKKMKPAQMHSANRVEERKMHISATTLGVWSC